MPKCERCGQTVTHIFGDICNKCREEISFMQSKTKQHTDELNEKISALTAENEKLKAECEWLKMRIGQLDLDLSFNLKAWEKANTENIRYKQAIGDIPLDRLKEICKAVRLIGQTGYAVTIDRQDNLVVERVRIIEAEIDELVWLRDDNLSFYRFAEINDRLFFGDNAESEARKRLKELTATSSKGE